MGTGSFRLIRDFCPTARPNAWGLPFSFRFPVSNDRVEEASLNRARSLFARDFSYEELIIELHYFYHGSNVHITHEYAFKTGNGAESQLCWCASRARVLKVLRTFLLPRDLASLWISNDGVAHSVAA
jgi:hypothetical protein